MDLWGQGGLRGEPAVTPGDHVLAPHQPGVVHQPLGDEFRVLDDVVCLQNSLLTMPKANAIAYVSPPAYASSPPKA